MPRESSYEKRFLEVHEWECSDTKSDLCENRTCRCAVDLRRDMFKRCVEDYRKVYLEYYLITLAHPFGVAQERRLADVRLNEIKNFYTKLLAKCKIKNLRYIGHIDIVQQDYPAPPNQRKTQWHVHVHLIAWADDTISAIRKIFTKLINGPRKKIADIRPITREPCNYGYLCKYVDEHKKKLLCSKGGHQLPYDLRIVGRQRHELASFYAKCDIKHGLLLKGFRQYGINIRPIRA